VNTAESATSDGGAKRCRTARKHDVRPIGLRFARRSREDGRGAESSDGEDEDEGADGDVFHNWYFSLAECDLKFLNFSLDKPDIENIE
jgi:hypothetical protein